MRNTPRHHVPAQHGHYFNDDWCDEYKGGALRLATGRNLAEYLEALALDSEGQRHLAMVKAYVGHLGRSEDVATINPLNDGEFVLEDHPFNKS